MPNPSGFAAAIADNVSGVYPTLQMSSDNVNRAIAIARAVADRPAGMVLTADEADVVSRCLLRALARLHVTR